MPVQIFDLDGALLAEAAAGTTREAVAPGEVDTLELIQQGPELPGFGPTSVPNLARLGATRAGKHMRPGCEAPHGRERVASAPSGPAPVSLDDAPSGSALSTLDATALFGDVAQRQFARS